MINLLCIINEKLLQLIHPMSLFSNQNFINQLAKQCGLLGLEEDVSAILQVFVEIQTRRLIQQAAKFMKNDCRDELDFQDIQLGCLNLNHPDILLVCQQQSYQRDTSSYIRRDKTHTSPKSYIEQQLKSLTQNSFSVPHLRSRWIYIDGKIPRINENNMLKAKSQILSIREKQLGEKDKKFNIIMDQPQAMLTGYQLDYYKEVTEILAEGGDSVGKIQGVDVQGNLSNLFPLFLRFLLGTATSEIKIVYFLQLLKNKYIEKSAEFHLHQILTYLWAYQGQHCLQVGQRIGSYIKSFGQKYPLLYQTWLQKPLQPHLLQSQETRTTAYSNAIKRIGIELEQGTQIKIEPQLLKWMEKDNEQKYPIKMARLFKSVVNEYAGRIACLRDYVVAFWVPSGDNTNDCYMLMTL